MLIKLLIEIQNKFMIYFIIYIRLMKIKKKIDIEENVNKKG
jgi:hypothetical protein